jgi:hypothetical protein
MGDKMMQVTVLIECDDSGNNNDTMMQVTVFGASPSAATSCLESDAVERKHKTALLLGDLMAMEVQKSRILNGYLLRCATWISCPVSGSNDGLTFH